MLLTVILSSCVTLIILLQRMLTALLELQSGGMPLTVAMIRTMMPEVINLTDGINGPVFSNITV
jgi:hypothetical protein